MKHVLLSPPATSQVSAALDKEESNIEEVIHAFEQVEVEIFKLLAYDPFLRFKRQASSMSSI